MEELGVTAPLFSTNEHLQPNIRWSHWGSVLGVSFTVCFFSFLFYFSHLLAHATSSRATLVLTPGITGINEKCQHWIDNYSQDKPCSCTPPCGASLCPSYIRDMQLGLAQELQKELAEAGAAVDVLVKGFEQRCARLMTT